MKVVHTESSLGWGGQENRTLNEMIGLRELGHESVLVCQPGARLAARAREAGFAVEEIAMRGALDIPALWKLRAAFRRHGADIVNTHSGRDTQLAGMAARTLGRRRPRIVRTRHLALPISSHFSYSVLPDHVVTVSRFVGDYLVSAGIPAERVTAVPTGIDLTPFAAAPAGSLRSELGLAPDAPLIGTVAILRKKKGHVEVIEAARQVLAQFPDACFVFAGDGPQTENLRKRIEEQGLAGSVRLLGLRRDVLNVLRSLDVFVLPTYQEALGTAFIEAGAAGCPAIGTAVDGVPEVIVSGETGLLVPPKDSAALAAALLELLAHPEKRRAMGEAAAMRVAERFSRQAMAKGMVALYERLLGMGGNACHG